MECSLTKERIRQGIIDTVEKLVIDTGLFNIENNKITPKNPQIPDPQLDKKALIEEAFSYKDDIGGLYMFTVENMEQMEIFLREISDQLHASTIERASALKVAGERISNIAETLFPQPYRKAISAINQMFGNNTAIYKTGENEWTISPNNVLVLEYLSAQPNSSDEIVESMREMYLSEFSSTSFNLLDKDLWLSHPVLQDPTISKLLDFAKKINPNFRIQVTDQLDENAISLIRDYIIFIRQGSIIDELPEEISHFFFELLPDDNPLKIEMMERIIDFPIYLETFRKYKNEDAYQINGLPDINKIKREASAKLIGEYIKAAYQNKADEKYGKKRGWLQQLIHNIMKFFREAFITKSPSIYTEPEFDINSPFREAASLIMDNDISALNLQKVPTIYDSVFFSKIENQLKEGYEASDIAKSLYEFTRQIKRQAINTFSKYSKQQNMKGIMEYLEDPNNKNINKIWDFINRLDDISKNLVDEETTTYISLITAAGSLAEVYHEMEQIPTAIRKVLKNMSIEKNEAQLIDNIKEMQTYVNFSNSFQKISDEFINLLKVIKDDYADKTKGINMHNIYNVMVDKMGSSVTEFKVLDIQIMSMFQKHIIDLIDVGTEEYFEKYRKEKGDLFNELEHKKLKKDTAKLLKSQITSIEQVRDAVLGTFPNTKQLTLEDGSKVDISRIKDISQRDYAIFLFASPTLISDPIVSNAIKFFNEKYIVGIYKGAREAKLFADKIVPIKKELADMGVGWYEAEEAIQNVQSFYDYTVEDNKVEKRVLLSQTNRFDANYQKTLKINELNELRKDIRKLQALFRDSEEDNDSVKEEIAEKQRLLEEKVNEFDKWESDWWNRPFISKYYEIQKILKDNKKDSPALRKWKELNTRILELEHYQTIGIAADATLNDSSYDRITQELAVLQNEKLKIQELIPQVEKETIELLNSIYEVDEVRTSRLRQRHRNQWVRDLVNAQLELNTNNKSREQLTQEANSKYEALYTMVVPKEEFYKERERIFEEINKITKPTVGLEKLASRLEELREREKTLLKPFRDMRGEINVTSFKYISIEKDENGVGKLLSESLKEIEEEIDSINDKIKIYSLVLSSSSIGEEEKKKLIAFIDLSHTFKQIINNRLNYKVKDVKDSFKDIIELSDSQAEQILSAINKSAQGDNSEFNALANMQIGKANPYIKSAYSSMKFSSPEDFLNIEESMYSSFKFLTRRMRGQLAESVDHLYQQLNSMYTNTVSLQYYLSLSEFFSYYQEYINQDVFDLPDKDLHAQKFLQILGNAPATVGDIESMMGDGVFETVIQYIAWKERNEINPTSAYALSDLANFFISIHKQKITYIDGEAITTWTPISYVKKPQVDPLYSEIKTPRFLTQNKIKDEFRSEKIYETDEDVINGNKEANVDINGKWLPLNKKDSPFWNSDYEKLKNADSKTKEGKLFKLLKTQTLLYLQGQQNYLPEGERLDLVIPAKYIDKLEQKKIFLKKADEVWEYIKNITPLSKGNVESEQNYLEDLNVVTAQNRDIYTGRIINEAQPKMRSYRRVPLERTSKDATSSIAMFFEDVNEWSAKSQISPIMKTYADVFKYSHEINPKGNKLRSSVLQDLFETKVLDQIPDNAANNPVLAKTLAAVNRLTTLRLMADPVGALINLTSGTLQQIIHSEFSPQEWMMYKKAGSLAKDWLVKYDYDFYRQSSWGLETQLIGVFNMIPDAMDVSTHLSVKSLMANVRSKLMAPRQETEKFMAIHVGLSVVMAEPIVHNDKTVLFKDIYELDPVTNLIRLKDEYKSLEKEWNPVDGTKVVMLRNRLMQRYTLLQGNFFKQNQSFASTTALGKSAELMKRWFASGLIRRYHGERIDLFTGEITKGYHLSFAHAFRALIYSIRNGDMKYLNEYFTKVAKRRSEKTAIRRSLAEALYTLVFGILGFWVLGYDSDDEDRNKKLKEMSYAKQLALLIVLRVQGELGTFIPAPIWGLGYMEMKRAILDPFGLPKNSFDNIFGLGALFFMQMMDSLGIADYDRFLTYQKSKPYGYNFFGAGAIKDKGDSKLWALVLNTIGYTGYTFEPGEYIKSLTQMQQRIK